jgi:sialic acid synthase SpsE
MATLKELRQVIERQRERFWGMPFSNRHPPGTQWVKPILMHCVSLYPCPPHLANVGAVIELRNLGYEVGYSDHTIGNYAVLSAVALGATVVEKHFTLDNEAEGPDHHMSATPEQFERMVMKIRMVETVLGNGRKEPSEEELAMIPRIRKDAEGFQPGL